MIGKDVMSNTSNWQFKEMVAVGRDYSNIEEVRRYDERHGRFRDVTGENDRILDLLSVDDNHVLIDFGAGTGAFSLQAARRCRQVYAVDVSKAMLDYAKARAEEQGSANIEFCHGGFLSYTHRDAPVDMVISKIALHHLPDFWKAAALKNVNGLLKPGGRFLLVDVVFSEENWPENISAWIAHIEGLGGPELARDIETHVREEYSTFTWIMEGLLERSGFRIDSKEYHHGVLAWYVCTKI